MLNTPDSALFAVLL